MAQKQMSNQHEVKRGRVIAKLRRASFRRQACLDGAMRIEVEQLLTSTDYAEALFL
jgi:hypothetical protein